MARATAGFAFFRLTAPCRGCPFRADVPPYLRAAFVRGLRRTLARRSFVCHATLSGADHAAGEADPEATVPIDHRRHHAQGAPGAGALLLMEREGRPSDPVQVAARLGLYDPAALDADAPVYRSWAEMLAAHEAAEEPR